jgi:hypothetical protein
VRARVERQLMSIADAHLESSQVDEIARRDHATTRAVARRVVSTIVDPRRIR